MPRRFILLNAALALVALASVGYMVNEVRAPAPVAARRAAPAAAPVTATPPPSVEPASSFTVVATRNLFSPTRTEAPVAAATPAAPQLPKPNLYGIILRDGAPVAYLEDPASKRVGGYRIGDAVAGGTVKRIGADHVVLNRPEGDVSVRLRDPSKPRPALPAAGPTPIPGTPGVTPPAVASPQPQHPDGTVMRPPLPQSPVLPRRPLPPNLLRRLPPSAPDAPAQR
jgi:hypothetical protein